MSTLRATFLLNDKLRLYRGARCELPTGEVVEVNGDLGSEGAQVPEKAEKHPSDSPAREESA